MTIKRRIESLENRLDPTRSCRVVVVHCEIGEPQDEATHRYLDEHGSDSIQETDLVFVVCYGAD